MTYPGGRHYLQIPGPTNVPDEVLRAMGRPVIDHRGPEFAALARGLIEPLQQVFGTRQPVAIYPASGTGAWEAALVNTLRPGDEVLCFETGQFASLWRGVAERLGLVVHTVPTDWRHGVDPARLAEALSAPGGERIRAVMVVHNETSTGVMSRVEALRPAINATGHDALLMVDTISSLGSVDYQHDAWGIDVTVAASQKGLMLPPGLSFNVASERAIEAGRSATLPRSYWDWTPLFGANATGAFPYTPATSLLFGLETALRMLHGEGLPAVFARHARQAAATRAAVAAWGLEILAQDPREYSHTLTAVMTPEGLDADALRRTILDRFNMSLGAGLGRLAGHVFRIGHLGHLGDLDLVGTLAGVEMGLRLAGRPVPSGVPAALDVLAAA